MAGILIILVLFVGLILVLGVGITLFLILNKINKDKQNKNSNNKIKIILIIIGGVLIVFIGLIFLLFILKINIFDTSGNDKYAICSNNSNTVEFIQGDKNNTFINYTSHAESSYVSDRICSYLKTIAYNYDSEAEVNCYGQNFNASYNRKESFEKVLTEYKNKENYKCIIYDDYENNEKAKILGSWCGYNYDDTDVKYIFKEDGTIDFITYGRTYSGYYSIVNNSVSYGTFLTSNDYYIVLLKDKFYYDEKTDALNLTFKSKVEKYNVYKRCD